MAWLIALSIVVALVGIALLIAGRRGRRVDDHPLCRACGFDLTGAPSTSDRCAECGRKVTVGRGPRLGHRRRRPLMITLGVTLAGFAIAGGVTLGVNRVRGVDWRGYLPSWWLLREASRNAVADRADPIGRLLRRDAAGRLAADQRVGLARAIVAVELDVRIQWPFAWGDWVAARLVERVLPADVRDAFARNVLANAQVTFRPTARQGEGPAVLVTFPTSGRSLSSFLVIHGEMYNGERVLTIDGRPVSPVAPGLGPIVSCVALSAESGWSTGVADAGESWRDIGVGAHAVEWSLPVRLVAGPIVLDGRDDAPAALDARTLCQTPLTWRGTVTIVYADDAANVRMIVDAATTTGLRAALGTPTVSMASSNGDPVLLEIQAVRRLSIALAADVFVQQDGAPEEKLTTLTLANGTFGRVSMACNGGRSLHAGTAILTLRPSIEAVRQTVDFTTIWGGELRIDNVPVIDPAAPATTTRSTTGP